MPAPHGLTLTTVRPVVDGAEQDSLDRRTLEAVDGAPLAEVRSVPRLLAQVIMNRVRAAADGAAPAPEILARAADLYVAGVVAGETREQHARRVARAVGLPLTIVDQAIDSLGETLRDSDFLNRRDIPAPETGIGGRTRWVLSGRVFASAASLGKHPGPNRAWLRALALGYSVVVRPGHRDPFTAQRLVHALLEAGLAPHKVSLLPGDDEMAHLLLQQSDRSVVFGIEERVRPWMKVRGVDVHCEGRSKVLLDHDPSPDELRFLARVVADEAGVRCDNASVILTTRDPHSLAEQLAEQLAAIPVLPTTDAHARLPVVPAAQAEPVRARLRSLATGLRDHTTARYSAGPVEALPGGGHVVRPTVLSTSDPTHPTVGTELPFPFVTVAPWSPGQGLAPLGNSLALTLLADTVSAAAVAADTTVREVFCSPVLPWEIRPEVPDHVLALLLAEPKRLIGGEQAS